MSVAGGRLLSEADLKKRLPEVSLTRLYDDLGVGAPLGSAVQQLILDAESEVIGAAAKQYPAQVSSTIIPTTAHPLLRKFALDMAQGLAYQRFPEVFRRDGEALLDSTRKQLDRLSQNHLVLEGAVPVAGNVGGEIGNNDPNAQSEPLEPTFLSGWGNF